MVTSPLDRKLLRDLSRLRGQVLTIALVVAAGIAAFVAMRGNYASLLAARDAYYERSRFADVFVRLERAPDSVRRDLEALPGVAHVDTRVAAPATLPDTTVSEPVRAVVLSLTDDARARLDQIQVTSGRRLDPSRPDEVLVLRSFAEAHGIALGDPLPVIIDGARRSLRVVGMVLSPEYVMAISPGAMTQDPKRFAVLWMSEPTLAAAMSMEGAFNDVALELQPGASTDRVVAEVDRLLARYGGLGAVRQARQPSNFIIEGELAQLESMSTVVPAIFLAVAALLLNVVLSRLVLLQRAEIATLKALGYGNLEVGLHYGKLVAVIALVGGALGVGLGVYLGRGMVNLYGEYFKFPELRFALDGGSIALALAISFAAAAAGAFAAVRRVVVLPPAEAMRPAAPASYRRSLIEVLGLRGLVGPSGQMVIRELERRPLRTLGSSLAIASSVGLLVVAGWYSDGLEALMDVQFHEVMREDVVVTFAQPRPARALGELGQLPGVLAVEGLRNVPVRFRSGARYRDATLTGYPDDGELRAPRDKYGMRHPLPPDGVVLTAMLGELLEIEVGDPVTIEVQEGDRQSRTLRVAGFVDEAFGLQGHMAAPALHRALGEEPVVSAGLLRVDPRLEAELDTRLQELPAVVGVARRRDILALFREQSGQMILTMTIIITLFAATITVGVVYNNARIALSMRARDLASLRVLGFRRAEISGILLGEMAIQVLLALPVGLWFGHLLIAGIASTIDPETYRLPIIVSARSHAYATLVAFVASAFSALLVRRKLDRLDLIGVLKTRE